MPELPEVEYVVRRLRESAPSATIRRARILHPRMSRPQSVALVQRRLRDARITAYERRAKNILIHLDNGSAVRVHLGMTGHLFWSASPVSKGVRAVLELDRGVIVLEDPRMFGRITVHPTHALPDLLAEYGPEPLDASFTWQALKDSASRSRLPVKPFLLDQRKVAGLGNIWAAEALFLARLDPRRRVDSLSDADWRALRNAIRSVLKRAIDNAFAATSRPDEFPEADLLSTRVYGRESEPCRRCPTSSIQRFEQAGRSTYFCPNCQC